MLLMGLAAKTNAQLRYIPDAISESLNNLPRGEEAEKNNTANIKCLTAKFLNDSTVEINFFEGGFGQNKKIGWFSLRRDTQKKWHALENSALESSSQAYFAWHMKELKLRLSGKKK